MPHPARAGKFATEPPILPSATTDALSSPLAPCRPAARSNITVFFRWNGSDEGDEISGDASAELQDDSSLEIELSFDNDDDATLTAQRA
jgi:hypothetical protein